MVATSLDLSQIKTDALSSASTFRTLIDLGSEDSPTFKTLVISDGSASASAIDIAQTWNNGVTKFTAFKMDITDTASNAGSLLMDLQVGGSSIFRVTKAGAASADSISLTSGVISGDSTSIKIASGTSTPLEVDYIKPRFQGGIELYRAEFGATTNGAIIANDNFLGWGSIGAGWSTTLRLYRDANDTLAQRRDTNPQTFRIYNTYTNSSTYERGFLKWNSNVLEIGTEAAGSGVQRNLNFTGADVRLDFTGLCSFYKNGSWYMELGDESGIFVNRNFYPNAANSYTLGLDIKPWAAVYASSLISTDQSVTGSSDTRLLDLSTTWNTTGTPIAFNLNVTDTASNASSRLMNLQVGGSTRFTVRKDGTIYALEGLEVAGAGNPRLVREGNNGFQFIRYSQVFRFLSTGILFTNGISGITGATRCNQLYFTNSNIVSQLNGTNPQTFLIYNTYASSTDYERGYMRWSSNVLEIGTEADGTGVARDVKLSGANRSAYIASPTATEIRDILISHGLMEAS